MIVMICDGCNHRIADDDASAARRIQLPLTGEDGALADWCGRCVAIVRSELPNLAAEARRARHAAAAGVSGTPVRSRALRLWEGRPPAEIKITDPPSHPLIIVTKP